MARAENFRIPPEVNQCTPFPMSARQLQMLTLTGNGYSIPEIARSMKINPQAVKYMKRN